MAPMAVVIFCDQQSLFYLGRGFLGRREHFLLFVELLLFVYKV